MHQSVFLRLVLVLESVLMLLQQVLFLLVQLL
jgi:hypothetical protein